MPAYYNEWDPKSADWLRELINRRLIPQGEVDVRSIHDVSPDDLNGFDQCHFFAGIGGWSRALRLAGVPDDYPCWTGSPPCQPFSLAGLHKGYDDERHLAPDFLRLIAKRRPPVVFGEQVSNAIKKHWLDHLFDALEREDYACASAVLPAGSVGAPHRRDRLFFGAARSMANTLRPEWHREPLRRPGKGVSPQTEKATVEPSGCGDPGELAHAHGKRLEGKRTDSDPQGRQGSDLRPAGLCHGTGNISGVGNTDCSKCSTCQFKPSGTEAVSVEPSYSVLHDHTDPDHGFWSDSDWLLCLDGKFRAVEPGAFPLAHGISARMGRLRGYGNAIVPPLAAEFIIAFLNATRDAL